MRFSYFPGCSLKASGHENAASLYKFCRMVGIELVELTDWNCCGSSSAHSLDADVARRLPQRDLSLAPEGVPLLVACPSCLIRLQQAHHELTQDKAQRLEYEKLWERPFDPDLEIIHFFEIFSRINLQDFVQDAGTKLKGIRFAPYYGCMLARPPALRFQKNYHGLMENVLSTLGAEPIPFYQSARCCGTYLSVAKPKEATKVVNEIVQGAVDVGAECIVTACAMCHLNLEIRATIKHPLPTLHFSELLSMALGEKDHKRWFPRPLVNPVPLLKQRGLL